MRRELTDIKLKELKEKIEKSAREYNKENDTDLQAECAICLGTLADDPKQLITDQICSKHHKFHKDCLIQWVSHNDICPLCREKIKME